MLFFRVNNLLRFDHQETSRSLQDSLQDIVNVDEFHFTDHKELEGDLIFTKGDKTNGITIIEYRPT